MLLQLPGFSLRNEVEITLKMSENSSRVNEIARPPKFSCKIQRGGCRILRSLIQMYEIPGLLRPVTHLAI